MSTIDWTLTSIFSLLQRQVKDYNSLYNLKDTCIAGQAAPAAVDNDVYYYTGSVSATVFGMPNVPVGAFLLRNAGWNVLALPVAIKLEKDMDANSKAINNLPAAILPGQPVRNQEFTTHLATAVNRDKLSILLQKDINDLANRLGDVILINDFKNKVFVAETGVGTTRVLGTPIMGDCTLRQINVSWAVGGTLLIKLLTKNSNGTFNFVRNITKTVVVGLNYLEVDEPLLKGYYVGFYSADARVSTITETFLYFAIAGDLTGSNITLSQTTLLNFGLSLLTISSNDVDLLPLKYLDARTETFGVEGSLPGNMTKGYTRIINKKHSENGFLKEISFFADAIGTIKVKSFTSANDVIFTLQNEISIDITKVGLNTIPCSLPIYKNGYIGLYSTTVFIPLTPGVGTSPTNYFTCVGDIISSATFALSTSGASILVKFTLVKYDALEYLNAQENINTINQQIAIANANISTLTNSVNTISGNSQNLKLLDKYSLARTNFPSLPAGWINNGFTISNGLQSPVSGGTGVTAYWNVNTTLDRQTIRARIKIVDTASSFAVFKKDSSTWGDWCGGLSEPSA